MRLAVGIDYIHIVPENVADTSFIENVLGLKEHGDSVPLRRHNKDKETILYLSAYGNDKTINERLIEESQKLQEEIPRCSKCGALMMIRDGKHGEFWGCVMFPDCKGTRNKVNSDEKEMWEE